MFQGIILLLSSYIDNISMYIYLSIFGCAYIPCFSYFSETRGGLNEPNHKNSNCIITNTIYSSPNLSHPPMNILTRCGKKTKWVTKMICTTFPFAYVPETVNWEANFERQKFRVRLRLSLCKRCIGRFFLHLQISGEEQMTRWEKNSEICSGLDSIVSGTIWGNIFLKKIFGKHISKYNKYSTSADNV